MRFLLPLLVFLSLQFLSKAQAPYTPFPDSSAYWYWYASGGWGDASSNEGEITDWCARAYLEGDTLIAGRVYTNVMLDISFESVHYNNGHSSLSHRKIDSAVYHGAVREDSSRMIYFVPAGNTQEVDVYNFDTIVGVWDTLAIWNKGTPHEGKFIYRKDSIVADTIYGHYRNVHYFTIQHSYSIELYENVWYGGQNYWIEGVGSEAGFLYHPNAIMRTGYSKTNTGIPYRTDYFVFSRRDWSGFDCVREDLWWPLGVDKVQLLKGKMLVSPNPVSSGSMLNIPSQSEAVKIYNMIGEVVASYPSLSGSLEISIPDLMPNLYLIEIQFKNGETGMAKLMVQ